MATQAVHLLKLAGDVAVRHANGNLRIPGFQQLDGCQTTVDMDVDPEVFIMLEPFYIYNNRIIMHRDMTGSSRRLRSIFKATIHFFQWRLPNGEKMLRDLGIENLPGQIFDEIKTSLAQTDKHFLKFPSVAIKRCLLLFTNSVLDDTRRYLQADKGDTTARDAAHEAWAAVKEFRGMMSGGPSAVSVSPAHTPVSGRPQSNPEALTSTGTPASDVPQPSVIQMETQAAPFVRAASATPAPVAGIRGGRGGGRGANMARGGSMAGGGRGGITTGPSGGDSSNTTTPGDSAMDDRHLAALALIALSRGPARQPDGGTAASSPADILQSQKPAQQYSAQPQSRSAAALLSTLSHPVDSIAKASPQPDLNSPLLQSEKPVQHNSAQPKPSNASAPAITVSQPVDSTVEASSQKTLNSPLPQSQKPVQQYPAQSNPSSVSAPASNGSNPVDNNATASYQAFLNSPMAANAARHASSLKSGNLAGPIQPEVPVANNDPTGGPRRTPRASLGKRQRPVQDSDHDSQAPPATLAKTQHPTPTPRAPRRGSGKQEMARIDENLAKAKAILDDDAEKARQLAASEESLALEVEALRRHVRNLERDKQVALEQQRRKLRPGLVTLELTPRAQERVRELFGPSLSAPGPSALRPGTRAMPARAPSAQRRPMPAVRGRRPTVRDSFTKLVGGRWNEPPQPDAEFDALHAGLEKLSTVTPPSLPVPKKSDDFEEDFEDNCLPPIGFFRSPRAGRTTRASAAAQLSNPMVPKTNATVSEKPKGKGSKGKASKGKKSKGKTPMSSSMEANDGSATEDESYVPTEPSSPIGK